MGDDRRRNLLEIFGRGILKGGLVFQGRRETNKGRHKKITATEVKLSIV